MAIPRKVLILALDSAEPALLRRWAAEDRLPNIKRLMEQGTGARLENPPGLSGATWPTLNTGVTAARHARYFYSQLRPGTYRTGLFSPKDIKVPPFWSALSGAGKQIVVVDVPKTYPVEGLDGVQIVDWANHDGDIVEGFLTWPPQLGAGLDERYGPDPFHRRYFGVRGPDDFAAFVQGLRANVERKAKLIGDLMDERPWDLLFACWDDMHWAGHFGWRLHDETHPHHDPDLAASVGDPVEQILVTIDRCIGDLLQKTGPDTTVLLLASHGMGPGHRACEMLDPILRRLEGIPVGMRGTSYRGLRQVWDNLPGRLHNPLNPLKDFVRENLLARDRAGRSYFTLPCNNDGGCIRLNVAGRDPEGIIQPGTEYDERCRWLTDELKELVNVDTGQPAIREVYKLPDLMQGPFADQLPDLTIRWNSDPPISRIASPRIGEIEMQVSPWRSGEHLPDGLLVAAGPGTQPGTTAADIRAQDFAPTVARMLGVPLPGVDGVVSDALLLGELKAS
jgi:predicted AlkP superfamily phosphohydrolase/phosphomutase